MTTLYGRASLKSARQLIVHPRKNRNSALLNQSQEMAKLVKGGEISDLDVVRQVIIPAALEAGIPKSEAFRQMHNGFRKAEISGEVRIAPPWISPLYKPERIQAYVDWFEYSQIKYSYTPIQTKIAAALAHIAIKACDESFTASHRQIAALAGCVPASVRNNIYKMSGITFSPPTAESDISTRWKLHLKVSHYYPLLNSIPGIALMGINGTGNSLMSLDHPLWFSRHAAWVAYCLLDDEDYISARELGKTGRLSKSVAGRQLQFLTAEDVVEYAEGEGYRRKRRNLELTESPDMVKRRDNRLAVFKREREGRVGIQKEDQ